MYKGKKSDIWACGVTLYFMIYKQHPFEDNVIPSLFKKIQTEEPSYIRMLIQLTDEDRHNAISKVNFFGKVLLQKIGLSPLLKATNRGGAGGGQKQAPPPSSMSLLSNLIAGINKAKEKQNNNQA
ncbi:hypothetical protein FGO68_gene12103 [Halteria grandinella]|uniref:Protein kinase domain-containing protein n=1 Tax=Halteria grandinella TaxID=5974 RepID=A0A8J8T9Z2_HALGN|nr:hypothetical protein FGO68_gene12103 [Halteria grandinella]